MNRNKIWFFISIILGLSIGLGIGHLCSEIYTTKVANQAISDDEITKAAMVSIMVIFPLSIISCGVIAGFIHKKFLTNKFSGRKKPRR